MKDMKWLVRNLRVMTDVIDDPASTKWLNMILEINKENEDELIRLKELEKAIIEYFKTKDQMTETVDNNIVVMNIVHERMIKEGKKNEEKPKTNI